MKKLLILLTATMLTVGFPPLPDKPANGQTDKKDEKPSGAEAVLKRLDPFYTQHVIVGGVVIASSDKVSEYARREVAYLTKKMLADRPDVLAHLAKTNLYITVMAYSEMQTDLPECRGLSPWYDHRARGLGGRPISCAEENLLSFKGDPYKGENIFIHEFAHGLHGGFAGLDKTFDARLRELYEQAKATGRYSGYGMRAFGEFWAEGVQSWFECNRGGGLAVRSREGKPGCRINTRDQLKEHLPELAKLIEESFGKNEWVYVPVLKRLDEPHLCGYDPDEAPTFRWPAKVIETFNRIEAENREKERRKRENAAGK